MSFDVCVLWLRGLALQKCVSDVCVCVSDVCVCVFYVCEVIGSVD